MSEAYSRPLPARPWWQRPSVVSLLVVLLVLAATIGWSMYVGLKDEQRQALAHGLPWQVEPDGQGGSRVFGLRLGQDRLDEVQARLGDELTTGVMVAQGGAPALEGFVESLRAGFVTGRLVAAFDADPAWLQAARERAPGNDVGEGGRSRRYKLTADDRQTAGRARLLALAYLPAVRLDAEMVRQRFGEPAERVPGPAGETQWLYPDLGVAVVLPPERGEQAGARSVIQYVAPRDFDARLRAPLRAAAASAPR